MRKILVAEENYRPADDRRRIVVGLATFLFGAGQETTTELLTNRIDMHTLSNDLAIETPLAA
jgi:hypothetical protein